MIKYRGLKDFGTWCKKGEIGYINNILGREMEKKGVLKIIKYIVSNTDKRTRMPDLKLSDDQIRGEMILNFIEQKLK